MRTPERRQAEQDEPMPRGGLSLEQMNELLAVIREVVQEWMAAFETALQGQAKEQRNINQSLTEATKREFRYVGGHDGKLAPNGIDRRSFIIFRKSQWAHKNTFFL